MSGSLQETHVMILFLAQKNDCTKTRPLLMNHNLGGGDFQKATSYLSEVTSYLYTSIFGRIMLELRKQLNQTEIVNGHDIIENKVRLEEH